jgi:hypothetical protein
VIPIPLLLHRRQGMEREEDLGDPTEDDAFDHGLPQSANHVLPGLGRFEVVRLEGMLIERSDVGLLAAGDEGCCLMEWKIASIRAIVLAE